MQWLINRFSSVNYAHSSRGQFIGTIDILLIGYHIAFAFYPGPELRMATNANPSTHLLDTLDTPGKALEIGTYDDFHTIDWLREMSRNRLRHRKIIHFKKESFWSSLKSIHDALSGWLVVLLVGLAAGKALSIIKYIRQKEGTLQMNEGGLPPRFQRSAFASW